MSPEVFQALLTFSKFLGIGLTGIFAMLGLLTKFRDEQGRITRWGYFAAGGILLSTMVAAASQGLDFVKSADDAAKSNRAALELARTNATMLHEIQRAVDPLDTITTAVWMNVDLKGPAVAPYRQRAAAAVKAALESAGPGAERLPNGLFPAIFSADKRIMEVAIPSSSPVFPDRDREPAAFYALRYLDFNLQFYEGKGNFEDRLRAMQSPALSMSLGTADAPAAIQLLYNPAADQFRIEAHNVQSQSRYWDNEGNLLSVVDLPGKQLVVWIRSVIMPNIMNREDPLDREITELRRGIGFQTLVIDLPRGRQIWLREAGRQGMDPVQNMPFYEFVVPDLQRAKK